MIVAFLITIAVSVTAGLIAGLGGGMAAARNYPEHVEAFLTALRAGRQRIRDAREPAGHAGHAGHAGGHTHCSHLKPPER